MSSKVSRRSLIKTMMVAGAALAAAPLLGKASAMQKLSGSQKAGLPNNLTAAPEQSYEKPLVLIVKGNQILGYRGLKEVRVQDSSLSSMLNAKFGSMGGSN
ncbi:MAG: hypothetical protein OK442_08315 [Thaumarchaeota archaeon]|nr:hypothetical protein [Nitrososphaerota archaeon]